MLLSIQKILKTISKFKIILKVYKFLQMSIQINMVKESKTMISYFLKVRNKIINTLQLVNKKIKKTKMVRHIISKSKK